MPEATQVQDPAVTDPNAEGGQQPGTEQTGQVTEGEGGQQQPAAQKPLTPEEIERKKEKSRQRWEKMLHKQGELKGQLRAYEQIYGPLNPDGSPSYQQPQNQQQEQRPKRDTFANEDEFQDALESWRDKKAEQRLEKERDNLRREFSGSQHMAAASASFSRQEAEAKKTHADYDEVVAESEDVPIPQGVVREILSSEIGAEIKYYLAKNPEEAYALNDMPLNAAIRKIGMIEGKLLAGKEKKPAGSKAPDPINPPAGSGAPDTLDHLKEEDAKKMPFEEWRRRERERIKKLKGK